RQLPGDVGAHVVGPRQAATRATAGPLVHALADRAVAGRDAVPEGTAAGALGDEAATTDGVVRPGHAQLVDRAAGHRGDQRADGPLVVDRVAATQLDLVAAVIEQRAVGLVVGRVVPVLDHAGVTVVGVGVDRALEVAVGLGPDVGGVERPLLVPRAVQLEFHRLVGALGLGVAHHLAAATLDVAVLRGVDGDPALGLAADALVAPDGQRLARVGDRPQVEAHRPARGVVDAHVVQRVLHPAVGRVDAPRPRGVDHLLEAEDRLVLVDRVQVGVHALAQVAGRDVVAGVHRADLRTQDRVHVAAAGDRVGLNAPALEHVEGALVGQAGGEGVVDVVGDRQVVAAQVAEQLGRAVAADVPGEVQARRDEVVHLDQRVAGRGLVL